MVKSVRCCYISVPLGPAKTLRYSIHICSLSAGPAVLSVFFRLPLSPSPWGVKCHGYRAQSAGVPSGSTAPDNRFVSHGPPAGCFAACDSLPILKGPKGKPGDGDSHPLFTMPAPDLKPFFRRIPFLSFRKAPAEDTPRVMGPAPNISNQFWLRWTGYG